MDFYKNLDEKQRNLFWIAVLLLTGLLSMTLFAKAATSPAFTQASIAYLDSKKKTVLELTAAATASSAAITMIPGDIGTPIADKLADISTYTMIVLCAVFLEKYLVTITGHVVFRFLIPFACLMTIGSLIRPRFVNWRRTALRVCLFSVILYFVIPASVGISKRLRTPMTIPSRRPSTAPRKALRKSRTMPKRRPSGTASSQRLKAVSIP